MADFELTQDQNKEFFVHILNVPAYALGPEGAAQQVWEEIKNGAFDQLELVVTQEEGTVCREDVFAARGFSPKAFKICMHYNTEDWDGSEYD